MDEEEEEGENGRFLEAARDLFNGGGGVKTKEPAKMWCGHRKESGKKFSLSRHIQTRRSRAAYIIWREIGIAFLMMLMFGFHCKEFQLLFFATVPCG